MKIKQPVGSPRSAWYCPRCGAAIRVIRQPPGRRSTYYCPCCQRNGDAD